MAFPLRLAECHVLEDLPNVGPRIARDLRGLGVRAPHALRGRDPYVLYEELNRRTRLRHDPCVLDTFIAVVRFAEGGTAQPWWAFTAERKRTLAAREAAAAHAQSRKREAATLNSSVPSSSNVAAIAGLRNLGPASARLLVDAGIASVAQLRRRGAVEAWRRVRKHHPRASLNLLWALEGALTDSHWQQVARTERTRLLLALEALDHRA